MIIRLSKFETAIVLSVILALSFISAVSSEDKTLTTSTDIRTRLLPIIMYHHITVNKEKAGEYTVTEEEFRCDLQYIKDNGYTTVTIEDISNYVNGKSNLPDKPIMITFDDGFESFYSIAYPILKENNMRAVVSVIGSVTEKYSAINDHNISYSNLTWSEINEMHQSGLIEFQNHSYNMHSCKSGERKGISQLQGESDSQYRKSLTEDLYKTQKLFEENCGFKPTAIAYPYGAYSKNTLKIVKECGFTCTLVCEERINKITVGDSNCLFSLGRYNRPSGISTEDFFKKL